jgi:hypothetical protein
MHGNATSCDRLRQIGLHEAPHTHTTLKMLSSRDYLIVARSARRAGLDPYSASPTHAQFSVLDRPGCLEQRVGTYSQIN